MNDLCNHSDCEDKNSVHYFMCHMTQEEFEELYRNDLRVKESIESIKEKLERIEMCQNIEDRILVAQSTLEKFEDHLKNINRLNEMVNELKGQTDIIRASFNKST